MMNQIVKSSLSSNTLINFNNPDGYAKKLPDLDIILDVLKQTLAAYPASTFINSLLQQYQQRGSLSKKQLEGLHSKAKKVKLISAGKIATIEAIILRKPTRYRSDVLIAPGAVHDNSKQLIEDILHKYPGHKRVLFLKMKSDKDQPFILSEREELLKFHKILLR